MAHGQVSGYHRIVRNVHEDTFHRLLIRYAEGYNELLSSRLKKRDLGVTNKPSEATP